MPLSLRELRRILRDPNPLPRLRAVAYPEPSPEPETVPVLALWVIDAEGLPPRPWRVYRDTIVLCRALKAAVPAHCCVARQQASDMQRTRDTWRGEASAYPHCVTERCAQGRGIREALDPHASVTWRGAGPGGRFDRLRGGQAAQEAARRRMRLEGLLEPERLLDVDPDPADE